MAGGGQVHALTEHALAIDRKHEVVHSHLAQAGAHGTGVRKLTDPGSVEVVINEDLDVRRHEVLFAERPRPPEVRIVDTEAPFHLVAAGGKWLRQLAINGVAHGCANANRSGPVAVEHRSDVDHRSLRRRLTTPDAEPVDAHGTSAFDVDLAPNTARIPRRIEIDGVLEHAREIPFQRPVSLR